MWILRIIHSNLSNLCSQKLFSNNIQLCITQKRSLNQRLTKTTKLWRFMIEKINEQKIILAALIRYVGVTFAGIAATFA